MAGFSPFQTVLPSGIPDDYQRLNATPEMFGEASARAGANLGANLDKGGSSLMDAAIARAGMQDELVANDANTQYAAKANALFSDFMQKRGKEANLGLGDFNDQMTQLQKDSLGQMPNLKTQTLLSTSMRYLGDRFLGYARSHADSEQKTWEFNSAKDGAEEQGNLAAMFMNNPNDMETHLEAGSQQITKIAEAQGLDADGTAALVHKYKGGVLSKLMIGSIEGGDPSGANDMFEKYRDQMDSGSQLQVMRALHKPLLDQHADDVAQEAVRVDIPNKPIAGGSYTQASSAKQAIDYFTSKGWSQAQAAGFAANIMGESGGHANGPAGDSGSAHGIVQWHSDRLDPLIQWANTNGVDPKSFGGQLQMMQHELETTESGAAAKIKEAATPAEAAAAVD